MRALSILGIALAMAMTSCSGISSRLAPGTYTVSAIVESYPDGTAKACRTLYFTMPGDCGDAIPISQFGNARLPFAGVAQTRGAYLTPILKLTGTWTGSALALTAPPTRAAAASGPLKVWSATQPPPEAQMLAGLTTAAGLRDQQVLMADLVYLQHRGIVVMEELAS